MTGTFTISLDFELHWGGFEKWTLKTQDSRLKTQDYDQYFLNTRQVIPEMLNLFEKYEVHVTWATVGMLLHGSKNDLLSNAPTLQPTYKIQNLSAYHYINSKGIGENEASDPFHFAPTLVQQILKTPNQELGTHTFAHYYCNEDGQNVEQFRQDLKAAQRVAKMYGQNLRSLVFPRNQFNDAYLKVCYEEGISSVRSNPLDWFWKIDSTLDESLWKRLNRGLDAYFPIGFKNTYPLNSLKVRNGYPVCIPASRLLRPYNPKEFALNDFKIKRIQNEMTRAAKHNEVYHLWWHPHNFGKYPEQSLKGLKKILDHFSHCRSSWNMQSLNMGEITSSLQHGN
jgi:peptidoglycan/xylan/chitin deacetylase (PgdA/CDA1 family)